MGRVAEPARRLAPLDVPPKSRGGGGGGGAGALSKSKLKRQKKGEKRGGGGPQVVKPEPVVGGGGAPAGGAGKRPSLDEQQAALTQSMGKKDGRPPCVFHHAFEQGCRFSAQECKRGYHGPPGETSTS